MKQNKGELQGVGKVFQFTLVQFVKNKANTITLIIMLVLTLFSVPVMTLFSGGGMSAGETSGISKVYWQDQTGYSVNPAETVFTGILCLRKRIFPPKILRLPQRTVPCMYSFPERNWCPER